MFRYLDAKKLSSNQQNAKVFFYPGADAEEIQWRLRNDSQFMNLKKSEVSKVFILAGTNNIDHIYHNPSIKPHVENSLDNLFYYIWSVFTHAQINVINILPRADARKNEIVHHLNSFINNICKTHGLTYINTDSLYHMFTTSNGKCKEDLFAGGYDNVHLNEHGYSVLGRHLKYLAHLKI